MKKTNALLTLLLVAAMLFVFCSCNKTDPPDNSSEVPTETTEPATPDEPSPTDEPLTPDEPSDPDEPSEKIQGIKVSPADKNITELCPAIYSEADLKRMAVFPGSLHQLNTRYPITCLRKTSTGYNVIYRGEESIAILFFNEYGSKKYGNVYVTHLMKEDFSSLHTGQTLDDVEKIDSAEQPFIYVRYCANTNLHTSVHYTKDGYRIEIHYKTIYPITPFAISLIEIQLI